MDPDTGQTDRRAIEFLAGASHELRTPLNAVLGMLQLALNEHPTGALREYLTTACDSARTLANTLEQVLDLSHADAGHLQLDSEPLDFSAIVSSAVAPLADSAAQRHIQLIVRPHGRISAGLRGDPGRLRRLVGSLVSRSLETLNADTIIVEFGQKASFDNAVELELGISEWGLRVNRRTLVPMARVDVPQYANGRLAMTLAQRWIKRMDGQLWTEQVPGGDGRFYCTLRLENDNATLPVGERPRTASAASPWAGGLFPGHPWEERPLSVLVVDDTEANRRVVQAILTKRGHHVNAVDDGQQAVEQVQRQQFDVVLMDAQMPTMNGLEATTAIRHLPDRQRSRVPIIAMTAHALHEDRRRCLAAGMNDYLAKPVDMAALVARVEFHGMAIRSGTAPALEVAPSEPAAGFLAGALSRLGGDITLLHEFIVLFRQDAVALLAKIHAGIDAQDAEAVARAAHNLKGLAANFDAMATINAAAEIERVADGEDLALTGPPVARLDVELPRLLKSLEEYLPPGEHEREGLGGA